MRVRTVCHRMHQAPAPNRQASRAQRRGQRPRKARASQARTTRHPPHQAPAPKRQASRARRRGQRPRRARASQPHTTRHPPHQAPAPKRQASRARRRDRAGARGQRAQSGCGRIGGDADEGGYYLGLERQRRRAIGQRRSCNNVVFARRQCAPSSRA